MFTHVKHRTLNRKFCCSFAADKTKPRIDSRLSAAWTRSLWRLYSFLGKGLLWSRQYAFALTSPHHEAIWSSVQSWGGFQHLSGSFCHSVFPYRQCYVTHSWSTSVAWIGIKLSRLHKSNSVVKKKKSKVPACLHTNVSGKVKYDYQAAF